MSRDSCLVATVVLALAATHAQTASSPTNECSKGTGIRILHASFGDQRAGKTCTPDLSLCKKLAQCRFTVAEMCAIDSQVKNLEVTWDCGDSTEKHSKAAAKDTEITLACENR